MAIPDYQTLMLPLLKLCADNTEHTIGEAVDRLAAEFSLSSEERSQRLQGGQSVIYSRVYWARTYLNQAKLLDSPKRGVIKITDRGLKVLTGSPKKVSNDFLEQFEEFRDFRERSRQSIGHDTAIMAGPTSSTKTETPEETMEAAYQILRNDLAERILSELKKCPPDSFERIVVDVLLAMGYGGSSEDAGQVLGKSGDGGIDGIIKEDRLGLDMIYIQAKRWENTVGRPIIQSFIGALHTHHARRGVFITTSDFSNEAITCVKQIEDKVILIDGQKLAELMIDFNVGVTRVASYEVKKVDSDYFSPME